jgi:N-acetylglutamate synthase-like GNAT family acetyltransferase
MIWPARWQPPSCRPPTSPNPAAPSSASTTTLGWSGSAGSDRLLRSLVVVADHRGAGIGRAMLALLEGEARRLGVERLRLLTNTAAPFFRVNGYAGADRAAAPPTVAASREFTALCPASATYLVKAL